MLCHDFVSVNSAKLRYALSSTLKACRRDRPVAENRIDLSLPWHVPPSQEKHAIVMPSIFLEPLSVADREARPLHDFGRILRLFLDWPPRPMEPRQNRDDSCPVDMAGVHSPWTWLVSTPLDMTDVRTWPNSEVRQGSVRSASCSAARNCREQSAGTPPPGPGNFTLASTKQPQPSLAVNYNATGSTPANTYPQLEIKSGSVRWQSGSRAEATYLGRRYERSTRGQYVVVK